jgi:hypothetical protein
LHELKVRGYHIVHVVPATPERPATPTEPEQWLTHPTPEAVAALHWPKIPTFVLAEAVPLPAPALSDFNSPDGGLLLSAEPFDRAKLHGTATPHEAPWPRLAALPPANNIAMLPVPAADLFALPNEVAALRHPSPGHSHHAETVPAAQETGAEANPAASSRSADQAAGARTRVGHGGRQTRPFAHGARRSVRIASLKRR